MRVAWLTDIHLNFVTLPRRRAFFAELADLHADAILLGGDIGESDDVAPYLRELAAAVAAPLYFVLGNHDYYFGSISSVRRQMQSLCAELPQLVYLTQSEPVALTPSVGLIGHDGWADGRVGDYERSTIMMNDYQLIAELAGVDKQSRWELLKGLANEAAGHVRRVLPLALERFERVVLLTHVPPLRAACWHEGNISDDEWAPHFVSLAVGEAILEIMPAWPRRHLLVLCGHTHGWGECQPLANVNILTGGATYGAPEVAKIWQW